MADHIRFDSLAPPLQFWLQSRLQSDVAVAFPENVSSSELDQLIAYTADAGIQPFLWYQYNRAAEKPAYPSALIEAWRSRYLMERIKAHLRKEELGRVLSAFAEASVRTLVLKGAALAYALYPEPGLRTACDIDLFVETGSLNLAEKALMSLGYERASDYSFETAYQRVEGALTHQVDLHWQLSDSAYLSHLFTFQELYEQAVLLPEINAVEARRLASSAALLHACIHLAGHDEWDHLVWLLDVDLLTRQLAGSQFREFVELAVEKQCAQLCYRALQRAQFFFATPLSEAELVRLNRSGETTALVVDGRDDAYRNLFQQMRVHSWRKRVQLVWENLLFPPWEVIHPSYKAAGGNWKPLVYAMRLIHLPFKLAAHYLRGWLG